MRRTQNQGTLGEIEWAAGDREQRIQEALALAEKNLHDGAFAVQNAGPLWVGGPAFGLEVEADGQDTVAGWDGR